MSWFKRTPKQTKEFKTLVNDMRVKKLQIEKLKKEMEDMAKLMFDPATGKVSVASEKKAEPVKAETPTPPPSPPPSPKHEDNITINPPVSEKTGPEPVKRTAMPYAKISPQMPELPQNFEEVAQEEPELPQIVTVKIIFALPSGQTVLPVPIPVEELNTFVQVLDHALINETPFIIGTTRFNTRFILRYDIEVEE